jgi:hypothetical protein
MRRILAISLFAVFLLPSVMPLLVLANSDPDANLPACCRRNGKHHCMMSMEMMQAALNGNKRYGTQLHAIPMKCPLFPRALNTAQHKELSTRAAALIFAELVSHPAIHLQTEARARVARDCARQKRGPPALLG